MRKSYDELRLLTTFEERYKYLRTGSHVGEETFGSKRWMNQRFYNSREWKATREFVIFRDEACDLGIPGREIVGKIYIHHINPLRPDDLQNGSENLFNPDNLITVTHGTHNAIHYGDESLLFMQLPTRRPGDTNLWSGGSYAAR